MEKQFGARQAVNDRIFEDCRSRMNREYASFLEKEWKSATLSEADTLSLRPEPEPVFDDTPVQESNPLPFTAPVDVPAPVPAPEPVEPLVCTSETPVKSKPLEFTYLGNKCSIRVPESRGFSLPSVSNVDVAKLWQVLSADCYTDMLVDCLCARKSLQLCDWAFYGLTKNLTKAYVGSNDSNEAVIIQAYILSQLGYKLRLATVEGHLTLLLAFKETLFSVSYVNKDGIRYYCFDSSSGDISYCDYEFKGEQAFSARIKSLPVVPEKELPARKAASKSYRNASATVAVNKYLIDFYDSYPSCSWEILAAASLSERVKQQLYPSLRKAIRACSQSQAANILLDFVQTGFDYRTDQQQFGREKSFFADECFHYPYCDCEDRSILFSTLVRDLLGLEVVLLDYPSHIATAVRFTDNVTGDYFTIDGSKYIICDPTFEGASIGRSIPDLRDTPADILRIN